MKRRVMFVTGTRAEFGLVEHTLRRIREHRQLDLQLVVTGMHLSREHGRSIDTIRRQGWAVDATVPWKGEPAEATGRAIAGLTAVQRKLQPDVVLVVGDRVEAFAAATAGHLDGRIVAHVHGGDRALGQVDDALRHSISKLAHVHFAATNASGRRLVRMGEDRWRVNVVGTPGLDALDTALVGGPRGPYALVVLHPDNSDEKRQARQARMVLNAARRAGVGRGVIVYPNNDPGWPGIAAAWADAGPEWIVERDMPREAFLRELSYAALLIGNSSSGIIEAASCQAHVVNIGPRQAGRERSANVVDVPWNEGSVTSAISAIWNSGRPKRFLGRNVYGAGDAGRKIADALAKLAIDDRLRRKLIVY